MSTKKLESMYAKLAGQVQLAHATDQRIRARAIAHHDQVNDQIEKISADIQRGGPVVDLRMARRYGQLLADRRRLTKVLTKQHGPRRGRDEESML